VVFLIPWTVFVVIGFLELGVFPAFVSGSTLVDVVSVVSYVIVICCLLFVFTVFLER
jgi:hypothetical protein